MPSAFKGLVLAAGFGQRLRPLTNLYPKPLLPFVGSTPLELAVGRLASAQVRDIAINSHYLSAMIAAFVEDPVWSSTDLKLHLSYEPEILGTGGVFNPLRDWLGSSDLIILNGDVVSTIDIAALIKTHRERRAIATMALLPAVTSGESAVHFDQGMVRAINRSPANQPGSSGTFACAQILTPAFLDLMPSAGTFDVITQGYQQALARSLGVAAHIHQGFWHDLGSPLRYWTAACALLKEPQLFHTIGIQDCRRQRRLQTECREGRVFVD